MPRILVRIEVKRWLQSHSDWLLIFDNADDVAMVREFLPTKGKGHTLLTTRTQMLGLIAQQAEIEKMGPEQGALFLLRRANLIRQDEALDKAIAVDIVKAKEIVQAVDGLPLALDQAGAYIEETSCSLTHYLNLYQKQRAKLLQRRGAVVAEQDHPEPVATTWEISFHKIEQANPAAADLLRLCAFLAPDAIPEEILMEGADGLGPTLEPVAKDEFELDVTIEELRKYSLIKRNRDAQTLTVHRLVQVVLRSEMNEETQKQWAQRAVRAVNSTFPEVEYETWPKCERLLPHARVCAELIQQWRMFFPEAARLLNQTGGYLWQRGQYAEAEMLYQQALTILEQVLEPDHPDVAQSLNNLALLYQNQGRYEEAEPLYQRALAIKEKVLGSSHFSMAQSLNNLALLYQHQGKYAQAEPLYRRALAIREQMLGPEHPDAAQSLNNLASLYQNQGKYAQAEPLYRRALAIREKVLGLEHPDVAQSLNNLALLYSRQGKIAQAEPLYQRCLAIYEKTLGSEHPSLVISLNNLAVLYTAQAKYDQAEPLYQRCLAIYEKTLGSEHPNMIKLLKNYAALLSDIGRKEEAAKLEELAETIQVKLE